MRLLPLEIVPELLIVGAFKVRSVFGEEIVPALEMLAALIVLPPAALD